MRIATVAVLLLAPTLVPRAEACPDIAATEASTDEAPATVSPCIRNVDFTRVRRSLELGYAVGAGGTMESGVGGVGGVGGGGGVGTVGTVGTAASVFAALELGYGLQLGGQQDQASYEVEVTGGVAAQRSAGEVEATGLVTRAGARLGPARVNAAVVDGGRNNVAVFPLTMELAHVGELAARPRLAARPEVARALYGRERVTLATRLIRVEGAGEKASTAAPGMTEAKQPTSWAFDFIPLYSGLDIAMQTGTRVETTIGGALLGVTEHTTNASLLVLGIEHRWIDLTMADATGLDTLWVLKLDAVDPMTGTQYYMGWGAAIAMPDRGELARRLDPDKGDVTVGGVGWFAHRTWGGFGAQYKREPFVTMAGAVALEDRVSGEVYVPRALGLVGRVFGARTTRLVDNDLLHDHTAGVELAASYMRDSFTSKLALEVGRTFYTALDDTMPERTGLAASLGLTLQHSGHRAWVR